MDTIATTQADALATELDQNRRMMADCRCGKRPTLDYEAGVTFGGCDCHSIAIADWQPGTLRARWNEWAVKNQG